MSSIDMRAPGEALAAWGFSRSVNSRPNRGRKDPLLAHFLSFGFAGGQLRSSQAEQTRGGARYQQTPATNSSIHQSNATSSPPKATMPPNRPAATSLAIAQSHRRSHAAGRDSHGRGSHYAARAPTRTRPGIRTRPVSLPRRSKQRHRQRDKAVPRAREARTHRQVEGQIFEPASDGVACGYPYGRLPQKVASGPLGQLTAFE